MRLYEEILRRMDGGEAGAASARYTVLVGRGGYFQGVKSVNEYADTKVVLFVKSAVLEIEGEHLKVEKYLDGDLELSGNIRGVRTV